MPEPTRNFTRIYPGIANVLSSKVVVGSAFDPQSSPAPPQLEFTAIWDTGASSSVISNEIIQKCNLKPTGMTQVHHAGGVSDAFTFLVSVLLPNHVGFSSVRVTEGVLAGVDMLVGMDLIGTGDFAVSNYQGETVFTYRTPSTARIDFVHQAKEENKALLGRTHRNDSCPCGSGKKFKKCCGKV